MTIHDELLEMEKWLGLHKHHPDLFRKAMDFEKYVPGTKKGYTWIEGMCLKDLLERKDNIIELAEKKRQLKDNRTWQQKLMEDGHDDVPEDQAWLICSL